MEEDGVARESHIGLVGMLRIVQTQTANGADILAVERRKQRLDFLEGLSAQRE